MNLSIKRISTLVILIIAIVISAFGFSQESTNIDDRSTESPPGVLSSQTSELLKDIEIKGRAPKTGYDRSLFSSAWAEIDGCDMRNFILGRDLDNIQLDDDNCTILSGTLSDPYTDSAILFTRGLQTSSDVQIDHVVAVSDAWQKGAQKLDEIRRFEFYNDPDNLLAVSGPANQQKGDSDAASWLPANKSFRCEYVTRQIVIKHRYSLWVTPSEYDAMVKVLNGCPAPAPENESVRRQTDQ